MSEVKPIFAPIPYKADVFKKPFQKRVAFFDPTEIYARQPVDPFRRVQATLSFALMFPNKDGLCACGCGRNLTGRQRRWATEDCSSFAYNVWAIIDGRRDTIAFYVSKLNGGYECKCGQGEGDSKLDHIIPVKHGGGGCWLNNFQWLCHKCHVKKTNEDFGWKKKPQPIPDLFSTLQLQSA